MPLIDVTLTTGRSDDQLRNLIHKLTGAVVEAIGAPKESIRVLIREVPTAHWAAGDVTIEEQKMRNS